MFEFEYFWAILLLFVMERICCLQEQFDKYLTILPDTQHSNDSLVTDVEYFANSDKSLKMSFYRLCRIMHVTMLFTLVYFCDFCLWFLLAKKSLPKSSLFRFKVNIPLL